MSNAALILVALVLLCQHLSCQDIFDRKATAETIIKEIQRNAFSAVVSLEYKNERWITKIEIKLNELMLDTFQILRDQYNISNLEPCTEYNLTIMTFSMYNVIETSQQFTTTISSVENIEYNDANGWLTWMRPSSAANCILGYYVYYGEEGGFVYSKVERTNLTDLAGCSNLRIQIKPVTMDGAYGESATKNIQIGFKEPSWVENFEAISTNPNSINLSWNRPKVNPQCVDYYAILYDDGQEQYPNSTSFTISQLEPCKMYNIQICIIMKINANWLCAKYAQNTGYDTPEIALDSIIPESSSVNISLKYTNSNCIQGIQILLNDGINARTENRILSPQGYYINQLKPCTVYTLVITVYSNNSSGKSINKKFKTKSVLIDHVENIKWNKPKTLLTWDRPNYGANCVKHYLINYGIETKKTPIESFNLADLPGCSGFNIEITPVGENGPNGKPNYITIRNKFKLPNHVENVTATSNNPNSITVTWNMPTINPDCVKIYSIVYNNMSVLTNSSIYTISNLEPCTDYSITVCIVIKGNGSGQNCTKHKKSVKTQPAVSEILLDSISSESFAANVSLSFKQSNCIQNIQIELNDGVSTRVENHTLLQHYYIKKLKPCTKYNLSIRAVSIDNSLGKSTNRTINTKSVHIDAVQNMEFNKTTDLLIWDQPSYGRECIKYYSIDYGREVKKTFTESFNLIDVPGCSKFKIEITPVGENDSEGIKNIKEFHSGFKEPNRVENMIAYSHDPNSITVTWLMPMMNRNCVKNFAIVYNNMTEYTNLSTYEIRNLEPCTDYNIKVCIGMLNNETGQCTEYPKKITTKSVLPEITIGTIIPEPFSGSVSLEYKNANCIQKIEIGLLDGKLESFGKLDLPAVYHIDQLKPCTIYNINVKVYSDKHHEIVGANKTFTTKSVLIGAVENVEFDQTTHLLTWTRPGVGSECLNNYIIYDGRNAVTSFKESYNMSYIPGCLNFTIEITPVGTNRNRGMVYTKNFQTGIKEPSSVEILSANSVSPNSITVTYNMPTTNQKCIKNYAIVYNGRIEATNSTEYVINNLEPCTEYNLQICIIMIDNETVSCTEPLEKIITKPDLPVTIIDMINAEASSAKISLEYQNVNCIKGIKVGVDDERSASFSKSNLPAEYSVELLEPCTNFNLFVKTYSYHVIEIVSTNKTFTTKAVQIGAVEYINFDQRTNLLTWKRPQFGAECIEHYEISDGENTASTVFEFFNLEHLSGCSNFLIQINPIGGIDGKGNGNTLYIRTGVKEPDRVDITLTESTSPNSITVNWNIPLRNPDCVNHYAIEFGGRTEYTNLTTHALSKLEPCTDYNIQVCVVMINNQTGLCRNNIQNVTTLPARPEITIGTMNLGSSYANISLAYKNVNCIWYIELGLNDKVVDLYEKSDLPNFYYTGHLKPCSKYNLFIKTHDTVNSNGFIYTNKTFITETVHMDKVENIEFNEISGLLTWTRPENGADCIRRYAINSNGLTDITPTESFDLSNFSGCSKYRIEITPEGDNDLKGNSHIVDIEIGFKRPDSITNLIAFSNSPTSISVAWSSPKQNPDCIRDYAIMYNNNTDYTNSTEYTIHDLEPCFEYSIRVCLDMMNNQTGMCTHESTISTTIGIPSRVQELRYKYSVIEWKSPSYASKCIAKYLLTVYDELEGRILLEETTSSNLEIVGGTLKSCQNYAVSVIPINVNNESGVEGTSTFKTEPITPEAPSRPQLISKTATSLDLQSYYENDQDLCPLQTAIFTCHGRNTVMHWGNVSLSQYQRIFWVTLRDLNDLTNYTCTVRIENEKFSSNESPESQFETDEKLSDPPDLLISSIKSKSLSVQWTVPIHKVRIQFYHIKINKIGKHYAVPKECKTSLYSDTFTIGAEMVTHEITSLEPYTKYSVQMAIENTAGIGGYSDPVEVLTNPDTPNQVDHFRIDRINLDHTVELKWSLPCEINGQMISIKGTFYESQPPNTTVISFEWKLISSNGLLSANYYKENRIKPEHLYNITIGIELNDFTGPMNETTIIFTSPAGIPAAYASNNWGFVSQKSSPANNVTLTVTKNLFLSTKGKIRKFTFLISERNCQEDPMPNYMFFRNEIDQTSLWLPTWFDNENSECTAQYQIQEFRNDYNIDEDSSLEFIIGNEICDETNRYSRYCNGPLKSGIDYAVIARVYTSIGYADTNPVYFSTENNFPTLFVILICMIIFGLVVGFGIMWNRHHRGKKPIKPPTLRTVTDNTENAVTPMHIYDRHRKIDSDRIIDEFGSINALNLSELTTNVALKHKKKNRYANILPYDLNRVYVIPNIYCPTDYINASYIDGYTRPDEYIAAQGPTPDTCYDFWNMIIEKNCYIIVMLTKIFENQISKCAQYYPEPCDELQFHDINITNVRDLDLDLCSRRDIKITKGLTERLIVQYHFQKWPDHGCPENELDLIEFIKMIRTENNTAELNAPIVVHCSAGVGRTGTLIALDILMQQMENGENLSVCETVKNLRYQRVKMVQTVGQYEFVHKCVAQYIHQKWPNS